MTRRAKLLFWRNGDAERLADFWRFHAAEFDPAEVAQLEQAYRESNLAEAPIQMTFEARVDFLADHLRKKPSEFLRWLRDFDAAATEIMKGWSS